MTRVPAAPETVRACPASRNKLSRRPALIPPTSDTSFFKKHAETCRHAPRPARRPALRGGHSAAGRRAAAVSTRPLRCQHRHQHSAVPPVPPVPAALGSRRPRPHRRRRNKCLSVIAFSRLGSRPATARCRDATQTRWPPEGGGAHKMADGACRARHKMAPAETGQRELAASGITAPGPAGQTWRPPRGCPTWRPPCGLSKMAARIRSRRPSRTGRPGAAVPRRAGSRRSWMSPTRT